MKTYSAGGMRTARLGLIAALIAGAASVPAWAVTNQEALALCLSELTANRGATGIGDSRVIWHDREPSVYGVAEFGEADPVEFRCQISGGSVISVRYLVTDEQAGVKADGEPETMWVEERPDGTIVEAPGEPDETAEDSEVIAEEDQNVEPPVEAEEALVKPEFQRPGEGSGLKRIADRTQAEEPELEDEDRPLFQKVPQSN